MTVCGATGKTECSSVAAIRTVITTLNWTSAASPITSLSTTCSRAWSARICDHRGADVSSKGFVRTERAQRDPAVGRPHLLWMAFARVPRFVGQRPIPHRAKDSSGLLVDETPKELNCGRCCLHPTMGMVQISTSVSSCCRVDDVSIDRSRGHSLNLPPRTSRDLARGPPCLAVSTRLAAALRVFRILW
jgi:hypothetical protein